MQRQPIGELFIANSDYRYPSARCGAKPPSRALARSCWVWYQWRHLLCTRFSCKITSTHCSDTFTRTFAFPSIHTLNFRDVSHALPHLTQKACFSPFRQAGTWSLDQLKLLIYPRLTSNCCGRNQTPRLGWLVGFLPLSRCQRVVLIRSLKREKGYRGTVAL